MMIRKVVLPVLAVLGFFFALWMVRQGSKPIVYSQPVADPPRVEFPNRISGAGIVEASTRNISVGTHLPGIVARVYVEVGRRVKAGDSLFFIDDRATRADLAVREARVLEAEASLQDLRAQLRIAELSATRVDLDLLTVRAPIKAQILQVNIRPGEYAPSGVTAEPLILLGNLEPLHVRVDIDENDAWRFSETAPAVAFVRGNPALRTSLQFEYIEKYVIPKRSLTGESTERVDTRVMQVVYSFKGDALAVFPGQLMDVFIEDRSGLTPEHASRGGAAGVP
jgi:multidrug efflux pump subunit AcrA (membrane-fusion protein)